MHALTAASHAPRRAPCPTWTSCAACVQTETSPAGRSARCEQGSRGPAVDGIKSYQTAAGTYRTAAQMFQIAVSPLPCLHSCLMWQVLNCEGTHECWECSCMSVSCMVMGCYTGGATKAWHRQGSNKPKNSYSQPKRPSTGNTHR